MTRLDEALPTVIPEGEYKLILKDEPQKQPSLYGSGYFWKFNFYAKDKKGNHYEINQVFTSKKESYHQLLKALGGKTGVNGVTLPPPLETHELKGKSVLGEVIQRPAKNDKNRIINEIISIRPYPEKSQEPMGSEGNESGWESEEVAVQEEVEEEEIPF